MSADDGIYILQTYGPEFRVTYAQAIDNIFGKFNDETLHWDGDPGMMQSYFGSSKVYSNIDEAYDDAVELSMKYEYLEDGVCFLTNFKEMKFPD